MACATLKRSLDWEAMNQRPTKRRRCNLFGQTENNSIASSRAGGCAAVSQHDIASTYGGRLLSTPGSSTSNSYTPQCSAFADATDQSKMSSEKLTQNIRDEIRKLRRYKRLQFTTGAMERMQDSESSGSEIGADSPRRPDTPPTTTRNTEKTLFTFKQVQMICERMLREREEEIRKEYDAVLTTKLAEQYDAFVKFTYDQIQKRYEAAPSYLS